MKSHVARILAKLRLRDRVQVAVYADEHGLVRPGGRLPARQALAPLGPAGRGGRCAGFRVERVGAHRLT